MFPTTNQHSFCPAFGLAAKMNVQVWPPVSTGWNVRAINEVEESVALKTHLVKMIDVLRWAPAASLQKLKF